MSLPKEPRQKMINMMYLVLTALLALNVSVEVLNAFKTVNNSIEKSNDIVTAKNAMTYKAFNDELADGKTANQAKVWAPPAQQAKLLSTAMTTYLDSLKEELINESSPSVKDGKREFSDGNLDAATRIFDTHGKGKVLYNKLIQYRLDLLGLVDPKKYPGQSDSALKDLAQAQTEFAV